MAPNMPKGPAGMAIAGCATGCPNMAAMAAAWGFGCGGIIPNAAGCMAGMAGMAGAAWMAGG